VLPTGTNAPAAGIPPWLRSRPNGTDRHGLRGTGKSRTSVLPAEVRALPATERPALRARARGASRPGLRDAPPAGPVADAAPRRNGKRFQFLGTQHPGCAGVAAPGRAMR